MRSPLTSMCSIVHRRHNARSPDSLPGCGRTVDRRRSVASREHHLASGDGAMSTRKDVVERYIEGFRRSDHTMILSCLTDDVVWEIYGHTSLQGKAAFD